MTHPIPNPTLRGIAVYCKTCGRRKIPRGRSAPVGLSLCEPSTPFDHNGCPGYYEAPRVGDLWPGETQKDFGYPVSREGTEEAPSSPSSPADQTT